MSSQINEASPSFGEEKLIIVLTGSLSKGVNPVDILNRTLVALREVEIRHEKGALYSVHLFCWTKTSRHNCLSTTRKSRREL